MVVSGVEAGSFEDHSHRAEDLVQLAFTGRADGQRGVAELLHNLKVTSAVVASVLVGGHDLLVPVVVGRLSNDRRLPGTRKLRAAY